MTTEKKRILTSYDRLTDEQLEEFNLAFPGGYETYAQEVIKPNGEKFYAVRMECEDAIYLIRVELRTDKWEDDDDDEEDDELEEGEKAELDAADIDDVDEDEVQREDEDDEKNEQQDDSDYEL